MSEDAGETQSGRDQLDQRRARAQRDDLFERAKYGKITGDEADAEAVKFGLGTLSSHPGEQQFRPEDERYWTLPMAIAWIAYLDLAEVREWMADYRANCFDWHYRQWRVGPAGDVHEGWFLEERSRPTLSLLGISAVYDEVHENPPAMSIKQAEEALWIALREDFFRATGLDPETGRRTEIRPLDWHELVYVQAKGESDEVRFGLLGAAYSKVLIPSEAVRGFWRVQPERKIELVETIPPSGDGYFPLYCAAHWIATRGGTHEIDPEEVEVWRAAFDDLLAALASESIRVIGTQNGRREPVPGYHFAGCKVDYPYAETELEMFTADEYYLQSYPFVDDEHWRDGFDDALVTRLHELYRRLMVEKSDVRKRWPFDIERDPSALTHTGLPGRPSKAKHLIENECVRRRDARQTAATLPEEAEALLEWLKLEHPDIPRPTLKTIKNNIRPEFLRWQRPK